MRRTQVLFFGALLLAGCRREPTAAAPPSQPTPSTRPAVAVVTPATQPVVLPATATFLINGRPFEFSAAKLVTQNRDGRVRVTLFSDDPPETVREGYTGNSFYFAFDLDTDSADDLSGQGFTFHNSASEEDDTTNGVYIAGGRQTLRPLEATVGFDIQDGRVIAYVAGTFRLFDQQTPDGPTPPVKLQGRLEPTKVEPKG